MLSRPRVNRSVPPARILCGAIASVLTPLALSCTLLAPLDGLSGSVPNDSGAALDGAMDAPSDQATRDSGADAVPVDARTPFTCRGLTALFCDDFEEPRSPAVFSLTALGAGGTVALDDKVAKDGRISAAFQIPVTGSVPGQAAYYRDLATSVGFVALEADVLFDRLAANYRAPILYVSIGAPLVYVGAQPAGVELVEQYPGGPNNGNGLQSLSNPSGTWVHLRMEIDTAARNARLFVDGSQRGPALALKHPWTAGAPSLYVGLTYAQNTSALGVHFDNVVVFDR